MTSELELDREDEATPDRPCAVCGHAGHQHSLRETELEGTTVRQTYCEGCSDWHEYVPDDRDV